MGWDPAKLVIHSVTPRQLSADDLDVPIMIAGAGFSGGMHATFVRSKGSVERQGVIPCNALAVKPSGNDVTGRVCPKRKAPGYYDLVFWLNAPAEVEVDEQTHKVTPDVPVNDVFVLSNAIEVTAAHG